LAAFDRVGSHRQMAKSMQSRKKRVGRPATIGLNFIVTLRIPESLSDRIDAWAHQGTSRSAAMRRLIEVGLKRKSR
jgi:hypothetical protein